MPHSGHELPGARPSGRRQRVPRMPQIVKVEVLEGHRFSCLVPGPEEHSPAQRPFASMKQTTPGTSLSMLGHMGGQLVHHERREGHHPASGVALRWADDVTPFRSLLELFDDGDGSAFEVDPLAGEGPRFRSLSPEAPPARANSASAQPRWSGFRHRAVPHLKVCLHRPRCNRCPIWFGW